MLGAVLGVGPRIKVLQFDKWIDKAALCLARLDCNSLARFII